MPQSWIVIRRDSCYPLLTYLAAYSIFELAGAGLTSTPLPTTTAPHIAYDCSLSVYNETRRDNKYCTKFPDDNGCFKNNEDGMMESCTAQRCPTQRVLSNDVDYLQCSDMCPGFLERYCRIVTTTTVTPTTSLAPWAIGLIVGAVVLLALVIAAICYRERRRLMECCRDHCPCIGKNMKPDTEETIPQLALDDQPPPEVIPLNPGDNQP